MANEKHKWVQKAEKSIITTNLFLIGITVLFFLIEGNRNVFFFAILTVLANTAGARYGVRYLLKKGGPHDTFNTAPEFLNEHIKGAVVGIILTMAFVFWIWPGHTNFVMFCGIGTGLSYIWGHTTTKSAYSFRNRK